MVKALGQAFDEVWESIASTFGDDPIEIENACLKLAKALISVAGDKNVDVDALKRSALAAMALGYRVRSLRTRETAN